MACVAVAPARDKKAKSKSKVHSAIEYYEGTEVERNDEKAWNLFNQAAAKGDANAQYYIAQMYRQGRYVDQDPTRYLVNLREAADHKDPDAVTELGILYLYGDRFALVTPNETAGVKLLTQAAAKHPKAMLHLGYAYQKGLGDLAKNEAKAYELFCQAASQGDVQADVERARCLAFGRGTDSDVDMALKILSTARDKGNSEAFAVSGDIYANDAFDMANDTVAVCYYNEAVDRGFGGAAPSLAWMYVNSLGTRFDFRKAYKMFCIGADAGVAEGYTGKALCHEYARGVHFDPAVAMTSYLLGAEKGDASACYRIYDIYRNGKYDTEVNTDFAMDYLKRGVEAGDPDSMFGMGMELINGGIVDKDTIRGMEMIRKAADAGSADAAAWYGNELYSGKGLVARDFNQAFKYLNQVAERPGFVDYDTLAQVYRNLSACYRFGRGTEQDINAAEYFTENSQALGNRDMQDAFHYRQYINAKATEPQTLEDQEAK